MMLAVFYLIMVYLPGQTHGIKNFKIAMQLVDRGSIAIIGPTEIANVNAIQQLCHELKTPQLIPFASGLTFYNPCNFDYIIRMSPDDGLLLRAVADVIRYFNWSQVSVLASRNIEGRSGIDTFKEMLHRRDVKLLRSEYFHLNPRAIRYSIRRIFSWIREDESRIIVLKCRAKYVRIIMEEATKMDMIDTWVWILADNQLDTTNYLHKENTPKGLQGLLGIRQSVGQGSYSSIVNKYWEGKGHNLPSKPSAGRIIDSILLLAETLRITLKNGVDISSIQTKHLCNGTVGGKATNQGVILKQFLRKVRMDGFMDRIALNEHGAATTGVYDVINLYNSKVTKVGHWNSNDKLVMYRDKKIRWGAHGELEVPRDSVNVLANKTITIVTFKSPPFIIPLRPNVTGIQTPDSFKGAVIDMLNSLKKTLHFDYVLYISPDRTVGSDTGTGVWGGVIGELLRKKADLAIGPITITSHRSKVVDFTHSFMTSGFGVVMATKEVSRVYFGFLKPFKKDLWMAIICSIFGMAVVGWFFSLLSPNGFYGRCEQNHKTEVNVSHLQSKNNLSLSNALWSSAAYYLGQGPDGLHPVSSSGRVSVAVWWFCITILASTYTANLTAYLTTNRMQTPINTVQDLSQQNEIDYGLVAGSQTQKFFEDSRVSRYQIMWEYTKLRRATVSNYSSGIERVIDGNYAFIHDAPVLQYTARKHYCGQMKLIGGFDHGTIGQMSYGFALHENSPFKKLFNIEILKMQSSGYIKRRIKKWLIEDTPCSPLDDLKNKNGGANADRMGLLNMMGVFILMMAGLVLGFVLLILEWFAASIGDYSTKKFPLSKALSSRVKRLFKHVQNPQAVKLEKKCNIPFTDNKATQTVIKYPSNNRGLTRIPNPGRFTSRGLSSGCRRVVVNKTPNMVGGFASKNERFQKEFKNYPSAEKNQFLSTSTTSLRL